MSRKLTLSFVFVLLFLLCPILVYTYVSGFELGIAWKWIPFGGLIVVYYTLSPIIALMFHQNGYSDFFGGLNLLPNTFIVLSVSSLGTFLFSYITRKKGTKKKK